MCIYANALIIAIFCQMALLQAEHTRHIQLHLADYNSSYKGYPDVFLLGVQKAATTSLHGILAYGHPPLLVETEKEPHFFTLHYSDSGLSRYVRLFDAQVAKKRNTRTIDSTPDYFAAPQALPNMLKLYDREHFRSRLFILILREPASRLHSWYEHLFGYCFEAFAHDRGSSMEKWKLERCNKRSMLDPHAKEYVDRFEDWVNARGEFEYGLYSQHIVRWLAVVPRRQMFILNMETLFSNTEDSTRRLFEFLGYPNEPGVVEIPHLNEHCNVCTEIIKCDLYYHLRNVYADENKDLVNIINSGDRPPSEPYFPEFKKVMKCL